MNESPINFSIIIVNYNSRELLYNCIRSIIQNISISYEIIIVDNASLDNSLNIVETNCKDINNLIIIKNSENLGFSKANNIGANMARGIFFHFLNPDTIVSKQLDNDYKYIISNTDHKFFTTSLTDSNGNITPTKQRIPLIVNYINSVLFPNKVYYWYTGASIIVEKTLFNKIGRWTEDYHLYAEDLDLFYKANKNHVTIHELNSKIVHLEKGCSKNIWDSFQRETKVQQSFKLFFKLNRNLLEYYLVLIILIFYVLFTDTRKIFFFIKALLAVNLRFIKF